MASGSKGNLAPHHSVPPHPPLSSFPICLLFQLPFLLSFFSFPPFPTFFPSVERFLLNPPYPSCAFSLPFLFRNPSLPPASSLPPRARPCARGWDTTCRTRCQRDGWRGGRRPKGLLGNSLLCTHPLGTLESLTQGCGHCLGQPPHPEWDCSPARQLNHCLPLYPPGWQLCLVVAGTEEPGLPLGCRENEPMIAWGDRSCQTPHSSGPWQACEPGRVLPSATHVWSLRAGLQATDWWPGAGAQRSLSTDMLR